jgi:hypothetical protein
MKKISLKKRLSTIVLTLLIILPMVSVTAYAEVIVNGTIDEADWEHWFEDDSDSPIVDVYWYNDSDYLYIGLVTDDTNENSDVLEFAFRASDEDFWIQIKPGVSTKYRTSGGDYEGWWKGANDGLPAGVNAVAGKTDGKRSYEISIELSILGNRAKDLPESFKFWYKVLDGHPNGPVNYYPNSRAGWWFEFGQEEEDEELPLQFAVPELPLGTIMALISMFLAAVIFVKKPSFIQLRR